MKSYLLFIYFLALSVLVKAQSSAEVQNTYGIIIGISSYENSKIPQLQFADKDANFFYSYLLGKNVPKENIKLLINKDA